MTALNATLTTNEATAAVAIGAPLPWQMTRSEYEAARSDLFSAGDAAEAAHPFDPAAFRSLTLRAEIQEAKTAALRTRFWDAGPGAGAVLIGKKLKAAEIATDAIRAELKNQNLAFRARWNAVQEAHVAHAQAHLRTWIDDGAVQLHPYEPGSPLLTMSSHEDVVRRAIDAGRDVPEQIVDEYPRLRKRLEDRLNVVAPEATERPRGA